MKRIAILTRLLTNRIAEQIAIFIAWHMPKRLALWAAIRVGANATQGAHSGQEVPSLTFMEAIQRWMGVIVITVLATFSLIACGTVQRVEQFNANVGTFNSGFEQLLSGKVGLPEFTLADLQNAKAVYDAHYAATSNPYDRAGSQCMQAWISNLPAMQAILSPAAPAPQGAQVTGVFSALAAKQIAVEDAQAALAQRQALLRGGFPAEVTIACAPLRDVIGRALSHGGVKR